MSATLGFRLGAVPSALDCTFEQPDGALISPATSGQTWVQIVGGGAGVVQASVSNNRLIFTPNGNYPAAAYTGTQLPGTIRRMGGMIGFGAGTSGASAVLIANPNGLTTIANITNASVHVVFTDVYVRAGVFLGNSIVSYHDVVYPAVPHDGSLHPIGWELDGDDMLLTLPDGSTSVVTDELFPTVNGPYATFEHFSGTAGQGLPDFASAFASML